MSIGPLVSHVLSYHVSWIDVWQRINIDYMNWIQSLVANPRTLQMSVKIFLKSSVIQCENCESQEGEIRSYASKNYDQHFKNATTYRGDENEPYLSIKINLWYPLCKGPLSAALFYEQFFLVCKSVLCALFFMCRNVLLVRVSYITLNRLKWHLKTNHSRDAFNFLTGDR